MKLIHLADLHLGKRMNGYSLMAEQADILQKITKILEAERPDAVLLAGDIYDKSIPSEEAVRLLDEFLSSLSARRLPVYLISGNHDSSERLSFAARLMAGSGVHIAPVWQGRTEPFVLEDEFGPLKLWLLPFIKPVHARACWPQEEILSWTDALRAAVRHMAVDPSERNVLAAHQYVTGAARSDSEELNVGGLDNVDAEVFALFDYVALGHLHRPQNVSAGAESGAAGRPFIRYAGSPLAYSFSETDQEKSLTVVEIGEKTAGENGGAQAALSVRTVPLVPSRRLAEIRGTFSELTSSEYYKQHDIRENYLHITLTDEQDVPDAFGRLKTLYPYLMTLDYDNARTRSMAVPAGAKDVPKKTPLELFAEFYELQNGAALSDRQCAYLEEKIEILTEEKA